MMTEELMKGQFCEDCKRQLTKGEFVSVFDFTEPSLCDDCFVKWCKKTPDCKAIMDRHPGIQVRKK